MYLPLGRTFRKFKLCVLKFENRALKSGSLLGIADSIFDTAFSSGNCRNPNDKSLSIQLPHHNFESCFFISQPVLLWNFNIIKKQHGRIL